MYGTPEYIAWQSMRNRCHNKDCDKYEYYGGRGISVCERWEDFSAFLSDMGLKPSPTHSIDRIDVNGNYEPENCRWSTKAQQAANRRPRKDASSAYKGATKRRSSGKPWQSSITVNGKRQHIGSFDTPEEAAAAYDAKAIELFGEFAYLNFPKPTGA